MTKEAETILTIPDPQIDEADVDRSPYTWVKTHRVPGTSYVGGSLMLLAEDGRCVGTVKVMMGVGATENDVHRALQTAGNPAKLQRFIRAARNGEQEANNRAEAAEHQIAEAEARGRDCAFKWMDDSLRSTSGRMTFEAQIKAAQEHMRRNNCMMPNERAAQGQPFEGQHLAPKPKVEERV